MQIRGKGIKMSVPMVKRCCCCLSLHTGTLIIGYTYSLWALFELAFYCLVVTFNPLGRDSTVSNHKFALYITAAVVSCIHLLCSILLVFAAYKKLPFLTLPWTIVTGILTAIFFVLCLTGISLVLQDTGQLLAVEVVTIIFHLARACVSVYCILVVHSRHKEIMYEEQKQRFQHSARIYQPVMTEDIL